MFPLWRLFCSALLPDRAPHRVTPINSQRPHCSRLRDEGHGAAVTASTAVVRQLLHEAAEPHIVFRITDGANDDWASWDAEWLVRLSGLPGPLGGTLVRSELIYLLVRLGQGVHPAPPQQRWED
jgi:hypothetical protein